MTDNCKAQEEALRNSRNQMINNVIALLQSELDERETEDDYSSSAKIALAALETYSVKMNKDFDKKYCKKLSKDKIEELPIVKAYRIMFKTKRNRLFSLKIYKTQEEAFKALELYATECGKQFMGGRIVTEYMRKDEWDKIK